MKTAHMKWYYTQHDLHANLKGMILKGILGSVAIFVYLIAASPFIEFSLFSLVDFTSEGEGRTITT